MNKTTRSGLASRNSPGAPDSQKAARALDVALCYASDDLFRGDDRIWIEHNGDRYSLRITRQKKLILTK